MSCVRQAFVMVSLMLCGTYNYTCETNAKQWTTTLIHIHNNNVFCIRSDDRASVKPQTHGPCVKVAGSQPHHATKLCIQFQPKWLRMTNLFSLDCVALVSIWYATHSKHVPNTTIWAALFVVKCQNVRKHDERIYTEPLRPKVLP